MPAATGRPESSTSRILMIFGAVVLLVIAWFVAPMFLPIWRWRNVDFAKLAAEHKVPEKLLQQEFQIVFRYAPRGNMVDDDPCPFQIVTMRPDWSSLDPEKREFEENVLVRATIISDKDGNPPSKLFIGNTAKDRYFRALGWRFPAGAFGKSPLTRPVVVYKSMSLEKLALGEIDTLDREIRLDELWENDDEWEGRADGFDALQAAEDAAAKAQAAAEAAVPEPVE